MMADQLIGMIIFLLFHRDWVSNSELVVGFARMRKLALIAKTTFSGLKELAHFYTVSVTIFCSSRCICDLATGVVGIGNIALRFVQGAGLWD